MCIEDGEISLEMRCTSIPHNISEGYVAEFVWKSTSYDRCVHPPSSSLSSPLSLFPISSLTSPSFVSPPPSAACRQL